MVEVELLGYKIRRINMHNNLSESGSLQLENSLEFNIDYADNDRSAEATLFAYLRHNKNPDVFLLELDVQAIFSVHGIKDNDGRDEASIKCYDELFCCLNEIMTYLAINTGLDDFELEKPKIFKQSADSGVSKSNDKVSGKIIEFNLNMDI